MHEVIAAALERVQVGDDASDDWQGALNVLSLSMEQSNATGSEEALAELRSVFEQQLPADLLDYDMPLDEQRAVVAVLVDVVASGLWDSPCLFWVIGKSRGSVIVEYLPPFVVQHWGEMSRRALNAALTTLNHTLTGVPQPAIAARLERPVLMTNLVRILQHMGANPIDDEVEQATQMAVAKTTLALVMRYSAH